MDLGSREIVAAMTQLATYFDQAKPPLLTPAVPPRQPRLRRRRFEDSWTAADGPPRASRRRWKLLRVKRRVRLRFRTLPERDCAARTATHSGRANAPASALAARRHRPQTSRPAQNRRPSLFPRCGCHRRTPAANGRGRDQSCPTCIEPSPVGGHPRPERRTRHGFPGIPPPQGQVGPWIPFTQ